MMNILPDHIKQEEAGLCTTCIFKSGCITRTSFRGKIYQCEEFNDQDGTGNSGKEDLNQERTEVQYVLLEGLCMNCDRVLNCTFTKPVTGIWNCDEYQ